MACVAVAGIIFIPVFLLIAVSIPGKLAGFKQVAMDRARASLTEALSDIHHTSGVLVFEPKQYGNFMIFSYTNIVVVDNRSYQCALATAPWNNEYYSQGRLAVTTNQDFIWLDYRRKAKIIPADYKVSKWKSGY
jgi:hypothetical protein